MIERNFRISLKSYTKKINVIWLFFIQAFIDKSVIELQSMFFGPSQLRFPFEEHFCVFMIWLMRICPRYHYLHCLTSKVISGKSAQARISPLLILSLQMNLRI